MEQCEGIYVGKFAIQLYKLVSSERSANRSTHRATIILRAKLKLTRVRKHPSQLARNRILPCRGVYRFGPLCPTGYVGRQESTFVVASHNAQRGTAPTHEFKKPSSSIEHALVNRLHC